MTISREIVPTSAPRVPAPSVPWEGKELAHFWALLAKMPDKGRPWLAVQLAARKHVSELSRHEWLSVLWNARRAADPGYACGDEQWDRIKWLQHEIGWTDEHLINYILKHAHIDRIEWFTGVAATKVVFALEKIRDYVPKKDRSGE